MANNGNYIDYNNPFNYPLQWIQESEWARYQYMQFCYRVNLALIGKPWKNLYKEELHSYISRCPEEDQKALRERCTDLPEGTSFILAEAVQTCANQMASGVDTYEYQVNDPYQIIDAETEDRLAVQCSQDYVQNGLERMASTISSDLKSYGLSAILCTYDQKKERNQILRINPKNTWFDTMYSSTGKERFRGYSTMISWFALKEMVEAGGDEINYNLEVPDRSMFDENGKVMKAKYSNKKITCLNDLDIYVEDLNKLASSTEVQGFDHIYWEYAHDLRSCYNTNWYQSYSTTPEARTNSGYNGQDVELTVMYDLDRGIEFKIINRRFVISMNKTSFSRDIIFPVFNPLTNEVMQKVKTVHIECPLIFKYESVTTRDRYPFPTCDLFHLLDLHDELCSWRAKRNHVVQLLSILRIETNAADASSLSGLMNIMGIVLDDIQGDINSINFNYSFDPIDSQINYLETTIKERLNAFNQFDAMQAMGDRASAAESGMAIGAVAQGLSTHQNTIMELYADLARLMIINRVVYSNMSEFPITNLGNYGTITLEEMALDAVINVKSKLSKRIQEKQIAANALALVSNFAQQLTPEGVGYLMEQAMYGTMPRRMAATFLQQPGPSDIEMKNAALQAQNTATMLQQNQALYEQNPTSYEIQNVMDNYSSEEVDDIISGVNGETQTLQNDSQVDIVDMENQAPGLALDIVGNSSELGSDLANMNGTML